MNNFQFCELFCSVFKYCFNKNLHNYDDISKNGYSRGILKKGCEVIIPVCDVTNTSLSCDSNYIINPVM